MNVDEYLKRLNYTGRRDVSKETLFALQEAHLKTIPYENLDIHLGVAVGLELPQIYDKVILQNRGGWCFELNGLLAWLLRELGFELTIQGATVVPKEVTHEQTEAILDADRDHMVLLVTVDDETYITDIGFGPAFLHPLSLKEMTQLQAGFEYKLHKAGEFWFFENHKGLGGNYYFDMRMFELKDFKENCLWLQTSTESPFTGVTVCYKFTDDAINSLRGKSFRRTTPDGFQDKIIQTKSDYADVLQKYFSLAITDIDKLWNFVDNLESSYWQKKTDCTF